nr:hypothetical protein CFP56_57825 [Quercus suber]
MLKLVLQYTGPALLWKAGSAAPLALNFYTDDLSISPFLGQSVESANARSRLCINWNAIEITGFREALRPIDAPYGRAKAAAK